ncbi:peptidase C15, pyroglutamyl peptidase I-like protein [Pleomassaria siparia CBS 279.74]|uniref:Peptidase C15, pyroglutamyl peptidase I-like protein n=1 Tax=Pleomassaria siparia CBS 279.74 TaxID=1314801 RepID=A0A6G1JZ30_9PLEO|nr:peptidase C15, pyroglutamyl peptidase I-like protein [Pleomassaria siparia CBS 279.74]
MPPAWAERARQPPQECEEKPVTVLVTGFGPFLALFPQNTSWLIASTLPALLTPTATSPTPIHIHVHHSPVRVAYNAVTSLIPSLLPPNNPMNPRPDVILHIGLAAGRNFYTLEKGSHRRGYGAIPDVDEKKFDDEKADKRWPEAEFPPKLETGFHTDHVLDRWRAGLAPSSKTPTPSRSDKVNGETSGELETAAIKEDENQRQTDALNTPDVRNSSDAGNYMCGFIYYNSLAHYYSLDPGHLPVAFLHVPDLSGSKEKVDVGRDVTIALIRALVESRRTKGVGGRGSDSVANKNDEGIRAGTDVNFAA